MGQKSSPSSEHKRFEFRHGVTARPVKGMNRTKDPGALPVEQFYYLQNVRVVGDSLVARFGESKLLSEDQSMEGCVIGIFDDGDDALEGQRLLYAFSASPADKTIDAHDQIVDVQNGIVIAVSNPFQRPFAPFYKGKVVGGAGSNFIAKEIRGQLGVNTASVFNKNISLAPHSDPSLLWNYCLHDDLVVGVTQFGSVYTWDGEADDVTKIGDNLGPNTGYNYYSRVGSHRGRLFFGSGDTFQVYTGSWTTPTLPAYTKLQITAIQGFQQHVYASGFDDLATDAATIIKYDFNAGTLSTIQSPAGTIVHDMEVLGDYLYYIWTKTGGDLCIGRFDGFNWTNEYKNLTTQFATVTAATVYQLHSYNDCLWVGHSDGGTQRLLRSPGTAVDGDWSALESNSLPVVAMVNAVWTEAD